MSSAREQAACPSTMIMGSIAASPPFPLGTHLESPVHRMGGVWDQAWAPEITLAQFLVGETGPTQGPGGGRFPHSKFAKNITEPCTGMQPALGNLSLPDWVSLLLTCHTQCRPN